MPDTGAPWNIPYVAPSDLVRDYPSDSEDLADAIALGLSAAGNPGIGSNVVSDTSDVDFATSSGTFVDDSQISVSFTPTSATSKVLLIYTLGFGRQSNNAKNVEVQFEADGAAIGPKLKTVAPGANYDMSGATSFLHSPATTSAITYTMGVRSFDAGTATISQRTLTAIEVAA
jgi:hypothetical protein